MQLKWSRLVAFVAISTLCPTLEARPVEAPAIHARGVPSDKTVIIQMFEWSWDSIATECTNFIGPAGYGYVQVSPAQETISGDQWWTDYQPVSYILQGKRGNREQFANMISTCHAAGVGVIVDTIFNHMAGQDSGAGTAGSSFTHYNYPGIYQNQDFHHCGLTSNDDISDFSNRQQVQTCELVNLADLATETEYVRARLAQHGNDLLSLGVDGLRIDAAKHIATSDIANILSRLDRKVYVTQEVVFGEGQQVTPNEYAQTGDVLEFRYASALKDAFLSSGIASLQSFDNRGYVDSSAANIFVTNHDLERSGASLNNNSPSNTYVNAMVFSLAHPYGTPTVLSSYDGFTQNPDAGAPNGGSGTCSGSGGQNGWLCQHRWAAVAGMVGFRNTVGGAPMTNWQSPQAQQIAFGRGQSGFVAINNADSQWSATFNTGLPDGTYCDVISGSPSNGKCAGTSFSVSGGSMTATVPARGAIAVHTGAIGNLSRRDAHTTFVNFVETAQTAYGQSLYVLGSLPELGSWNPDNAVALCSEAYPTWTMSVDLPAHVSFEYKFIRKADNGSVEWESGPNHIVAALNSGDAVSLTTSWQ
ncbi:glycoside hydrolase [Trametes meyenii]|nr:glycoside hydrolase [Trametes meyenii]